MLLPIEGKKGERYLSQRSGEKEKNVFVQRALRCVLVTGYGIHTKKIAGRQIFLKTAYVLKEFSIGMFLK